MGQRSSSDKNDDGDSRRNSNNNTNVQYHRSSVTNHRDHDHRGSTNVVSNAAMKSKSDDTMAPPPLRRRRSNSYGLSTTSDDDSDMVRINKSGGNVKSGMLYGVATNSRKNVKLNSHTTKPYMFQSMYSSLATLPKAVPTPCQPIPRSEWQPDHASDECEGCHATFNVVVRRHHCRVCGHLFCNQCSSKRLPVAEPRRHTVSHNSESMSDSTGSTSSGGREVRVCQSCYTAYLDLPGEEDFVYALRAKAAHHHQHHHHHNHNSRSHSKS